jgi:hypothetical protein
MGDYTAEELQAARAPIASLLSKSEKAQQKLAPGTWQHAMLRDNIKALRIGLALLQGEASGTAGVGTADLQQALDALASMIAKTEKAEAQFPPGTSQHTLQRNRLRALRIAEALTRAELDHAE